ncbi:MAG: hypothetical protein PVJ00_10735, partial [Desulfobacterales bacterium]
MSATACDYTRPSFPDIDNICNQTGTLGSLWAVLFPVNLRCGYAIVSFQAFGPKIGVDIPWATTYTYGGKVKMEMLILFLVIGVWILLQAVILPKMGIST